MSATKAERILPAEVFDLLCHSAERFGGVGSGQFGDDMDSSTPNCAYGHARFLNGERAHPYDLTGRAGFIAKSLADAGIFTGHNDSAVRAIRERLGLDRGARVPFKEWAKELNVVRGDS